MRDVHVTVAAVVERDGRFLLVEEQAGHRTVLNQPAGHWEPAESLQEAMVRETQEETGWEVEPIGLLGIYEFQPDDLPYTFLRFAYLARPLRHHAGQPLDAGIVRALWLDAAELRAEVARHRSPMVMRCVEDAQSGARLSLDAIRHL